MACLRVARIAVTVPQCDERGAVYVEFLIAFIPLFILVLGISQLAFIASAKAVVEHSAWAAARSAVVVLEDDPERYGGVMRGNHLSPSNKHVLGITELMAMLNIDTGDLGQAATLAANGVKDYGISQGAHSNRISESLSRYLQISSTLPSRMTPIRAAAYMPLLPLANTDVNISNESIRYAIHDQFFFRMQAALQYTRAATAVTLHDTPDNEALALAVFSPNASVTTRVIYLFSCDVPVVRQFMCRSFASIQSTSRREWMLALSQAEGAFQRGSVLVPSGRYSLLVGKATLVNQGAGYEERE